MYKLLFCYDFKLSKTNISKTLNFLEKNYCLSFNESPCILYIMLNVQRL